jgi:aspartate dehydrogenase
MDESPQGVNILKIGIIGYGAMAQSLCRLLEVHAPQIQVVKVLIRSGSKAQTKPLPLGAEFAFTTEQLLAGHLDMVVECAGHAALKQVGPDVLKSGVDLLIASVGAMADAPTEQALTESALQSGAKLRIPAGAVGGLDVLGAGKLAGIDSVIYSSRKHPNAWKGTPAEKLVDLEHLNEPTTFFVGHARHAAVTFPQNANVAAVVALASIGLDRTQVTLTADPSATGNTHGIHAKGNFGEVTLTISGKTLADNPRTSMLAPLSLVRSLMNLELTVVIG